MWKAGEARSGLEDIYCGSCGGILSLSLPSRQRQPCFGKVHVTPGILRHFQQFSATHAITCAWWRTTQQENNYPNCWRATGIIVVLWRLLICHSGRASIDDQCVNFISGSEIPRAWLVPGPETISTAARLWQSETAPSPIRGYSNLTQRTGGQRVSGKQLQSLPLPPSRSLIGESGSICIRKKRGHVTRNEAGSLHGLNVPSALIERIHTRY